jgi:hypothetical protein
MCLVVRFMIFYSVSSEYFGYTLVRGVEVQLHSFLTLALEAGEWPDSRPGHFAPGKEPRYPFNRRLGGLQSRSGYFGCGKNIFILVRKMILK